MPLEAAQSASSRERTLNARVGAVNFAVTNLATVVAFPRQASTAAGAPLLWAVAGEVAVGTAARER